MPDGDTQRTADAASGAVRVGIGGWSYPPWRGTFYPPGLPQARELEHAATRVTAIEINATFYKLQTPALFERWAAATPAGFRFAIKGSRFCTNRKILADAGEAVERFCSQGLTALGDRLGPLLWQFAATKRFEADDFGAFLGMLPASRDGVRLRHAVEVGHESFGDPAFVNLTRAHGVAIAFLDPSPLQALWVPTADFTYARLKGMREGEPTGYTGPEVDHWAARARDWATARDAYVFMINGAKERAPAAAEALIARLAG